MTESLRLIRADELSANTAQTPGMRRAAAISGDLVGSHGLWMGRTVMEPRQASGDHHHGDSETGIYVVSGTPAFAFRDPVTGEVTWLESKPGDFVWIPPHAPHREENPADAEAVLVVVRSTQEAIVVNLPGL